MKQSTVLIDEEIDCIANEIIKEVETASSKDLSQSKYTKKILQWSDLHYTTKLLQEIESATSGSAATIEKKSSNQSTAAFNMDAEALFYYQVRYYVGPRRDRYNPLRIAFWPNRCCLGSCHRRAYIYRRVDCNKIIWYTNSQCLKKYRTKIKQA